MLWGTAPALLKLVVSDLGPSWTAELRLLIAGALAGTVIAFGGRHLNLAQHWRVYAVGGMLNIGLPYWMNAYAVLSMSASSLACFSALSALMVRSLTAANDRRFTLRTTLGLLLGSVGVALLAGFTATGMSGDWKGICAALTAAGSIAMGAVYTRRHTEAIPMDTAVAGNLIMASVFMLPSLAISDLPVRVSLETALALLLVASISTVVPFFLYFRLIATRGPQVAVLVNYLIPLFGIVWGAIVLGESLRAAQAVGLGAILLGVVLLVTPGRTP